MSDTVIYPMPAAWAASAFIDATAYERLCAEAATDPDSFWRREAGCIDWMTPFSRVKETSFAEADFGVRWFGDGTLNVSVSCLDRHAAVHPDAAAIIWEGDDPAFTRTLSFAELLAETCRFANVLRDHGVRRGDRATIYLPTIPEAAVAMLACTRIGAIHSIVFGGFSPESLANRIGGCDSRVIVTADQGLRGGKAVPRKANVDAALVHSHCAGVERVIVVRRTGAT